MLRTIFMIGLFAFLGLFALKLVFGVFGLLFAILGPLLKLAVWMLIVGALIYFAVRVLSPDTARRWRSKWGNA
ncbi:MAG TPA: hypothetical protein VFO55_13010 [Gemmatimonadaceae bacterium]|nr:hypothetical protein [Gemmatimonadaceae bacterium]